jgi:hypothetical protein
MDKEDKGLSAEGSYPSYQQSAYPYKYELPLLQWRCGTGFLAEKR